MVAVFRQSRIESDLDPLSPLPYPSFPLPSTHLSPSRSVHVVPIAVDGYGLCSTT